MLTKLSDLTNNQTTLLTIVCDIHQVKFATPPKPKWRARHSLKSAQGRRQGRSALQSLQPHADNPRLLVGAGSPRTTACGKGGKKKVRKGGGGGGKKKD